MCCGVEDFDCKGKIIGRHIDHFWWLTICDDLAEIKILTWKSRSECCDLDDFTMVTVEVLGTELTVRVKVNDMDAVTSKI